MTAWKRGGWGRFSDVLKLGFLEAAAAPVVVVKEKSVIRKIRAR